MPIPDYQTLMLPVLRFASDGAEHSTKETREALASRLNLGDEERQELLPSGRQSIFDNRVAWAGTYLKQAGLLEATRRGHYSITDRGREALAGNPDRIDVQFLSAYPEFREFRGRRKDSEQSDSQDDSRQSATPEETLEQAYESIRSDLTDQLLDQIKAMSPRRFEELVVELLVKMGYGGSRKDAGQALGRSGDEGIDGIIKEDRLGLDTIYLQAKRWENTVGRPEIQQFAGALQGQRAKKGVFITSSSFSQAARDYAARIEARIILINGETLASLMIDNNVGVSPVSSYDVKRIDTDYFSEE